MEIVPFRRSGKWLVGAIVQESDEGKRRVKIFKGRIKDDGKYEVTYKGERLRFSLSQRFNIPSARYWEWLKGEVDVVVNRNLKPAEKPESERDGGEPTIIDFV
ncbi:MAG TPA: hypothetical protein EYH14_02445 [Euryarchaeota archaeon]|nr:hypothetical protein [Euryarchaeota archaeon]